MVAHKAVRMDNPAITFHHIGKDHEKHPVVFSICKNVLPGISPGGYMIKTTFVFYAYRPCHEEQVSHMMAKSKT